MKTTDTLGRGMVGKKVLWEETHPNFDGKTLMKKQFSGEVISQTYDDGEFVCLVQRPDGIIRQLTAVALVVVNPGNALPKTLA